MAFLILWRSKQAATFVFSLWPIQWKEHLCVLQVLALMPSLRSSIVSYWTPWRQRGLRLPFLVNCTPFCAQNFSNWHRTKLTNKSIGKALQPFWSEKQTKMMVFQRKDFSLLKVKVKPNKEEILAIKQSLFCFVFCVLE